MTQQQRALALLDEGLQLQRRGQPAQAANAFRKALALQPSLAAATHHYGLALLDLGQAEMGIGLMRQSLAAEPAHAGFHANLARALGANAPSEALRLAARAAELAPDDVEIRLQHARLARVAGDERSATAAYEAAGRLAPGRSEIPRALSELHYVAHRMDAALASQAEALRLRPALAPSLRIGHAVPATDGIEAETRLGLADVRQCPLDEAGLQAAVGARDLHVIDGVLDDWPAYRRHVLAQPFEAERYQGQNYPGIQTAGLECGALMQRIATLLGRPIKFISPDNGAVRLSYGHSLARGDIHVDAHAGRLPAYAGVLYLNPPEQCRGGTLFWRHDETGWEQRPDDAALLAAGYADAAAFQRRWLPRGDAVAFERLAQQRTGWSPVFELPMVTNRLVVYRGDWFHSISEVFGSGPSDGRLAQLFFFELAG